MEQVRNLKNRIARNKKEILVVVAWSIAIALIFVRTHQYQYSQIQRYTVEKQMRIPFVWAYQATIYTELDILLLVATSFMVGIFLEEVKTLVYCHFAALFLSFSIGVVYVFLYVLYRLEIGAILAQTSYGWEWVFWFALINILRFMIPFGILFTLLGVVSGNFARFLLKG